MSFINCINTIYFYYCYYSLSAVNIYVISVIDVVYTTFSRSNSVHKCSWCAPINCQIILLCNGIKRSQSDMKEKKFAKYFKSVRIISSLAEMIRILDGFAKIGRKCLKCDSSRRDVVTLNQFYVTSTASTKLLKQVSIVIYCKIVMSSFIWFSPWCALCMPICGEYRSVVCNAVGLNSSAPSLRRARIFHLQISDRFSLHKAVPRYPKQKKKRQKRIDLYIS